MRSAVLVAGSALVLAACAATPRQAENWPAAAGPRGDWTVQTAQPPPEVFSVTSGLNILWRQKLPEGGQSGLVVDGGRVFLSIIKPIKEVRNGGDLMVTDITAMCLDAADGHVLWQHDLAGTAPSEAMYGFSDSSSPTPVADGKHVVFTNASGRQTCFDYDGRTVWDRPFRPVMELNGTHFPFNKQFEPMLAGGLVLNMEPDWKGEAGPAGWNHLFAFDAATGERRWISEDPLTHYNMPALWRRPDGSAAVLMGRGAYHGVPEAPSGLTLTDLQTGKRLWRFEAKEGITLYNEAVHDGTAFWWSDNSGELQLVNAATGAAGAKWSLTKKVELNLWDAAAGKHGKQTGVDLAQRQLKVFPAWFSNIQVGRKLFFLCFKPGAFRQKIGPSYCAARLDLDSGRIEYLELPTAVDRSAGAPRYQWGTEAKSGTKNSRGLDVAHDKRSQRDGWHWNFNGNPIAVNHRIYYTTMSGLVYTLATDTADFGPEALLGVSDLGPAGDTWTVNTPSVADGRLYHRTLKEIICVGAPAAKR